MICFPNAKINLGLLVTGKRADGYHSIESIFYPVNIEDALEAVPNDSDECNFHFSGAQIEGTTENNLVYKAWKLLRDRHQIGGVDFALLKKIPMGAGMGGGSADGAFALKLLNDLFKLNLSPQTLKAYSAQLGSDCAFFIENRPCFVSGRGEILEPIELDLSTYHFAFIKPPIHVGTAEAYQLITPAPSEVDLKQLIQKPVSTWKEKLSNDFEAPIASKYPEIAKAKDTLYEMGAIYASMTGSGSAVYGIFESVPVKPVGLPSGWGYFGG